MARSLSREGIEFVQEDNAFLRVADLPRAQALADAFNPEQLHRRLTLYAHWLCPVADVFAQDDWHWSIRLSGVGVIRPPGVGIYRPLDVAPKGISKHPVDGAILPR